MLCYEIINPSDKTSFMAPNLMIASLVTMILGGGQYGAEPENPDENEGVPLMLFGGADEWWQEHFPDEPMEGAIDRHQSDVAACLRTVAYGGITDRKLFDSAIKAIDHPEKRDAFVKEWNDRNRSSLNNIMGRAHEIAANLEAKAA